MILNEWKSLLNRSTVSLKPTNEKMKKKKQRDEEGLSLQESLCFKSFLGPDRSPRFFFAKKKTAIAGARRLCMLVLALSSFLRFWWYVRHLACKWLPGLSWTSWFCLRRGDIFWGAYYLAPFEESVYFYLYGSSANPRHHTLRKMM